MPVAACSDDDTLIIEGELEYGGVSAIAVVAEEGSAFVLHEDFGFADGGVGLYLDIAALTPANGLNLVFFIIGRFDKHAVGVQCFLGALLGSRNALFPFIKHLHARLASSSHLSN